MADFAVQRKNMVESQVRPSDVTDRRVVRAMLEIPREAFVPAAARAIAYMDESIPLGPVGAGRGGRALMAPRVLAKMIQALDIGDKANVLVVGAATGYASAVLARLAARVVAIESDAAMVAAARAALAGLDATNVSVETAAGGLAAGWPQQAPYDAILIDGAVPAIPDALLDQLKDGGRLVAVIADAGLGRAMQWRRLGGMFDQRAVFDAGAPRLPGFERAAQFVF